MKDLPQIKSYGQYTNDNYGAHTLCVDLGNIALYYSYSTIVAYVDYTDCLVCCQNRWGPTTGKHLNWIQPDHSKRLDSEAFDKMLTAALKRHIQ